MLMKIPNRVRTEEYRGRAGGNTWGDVSSELEEIGSRASLRGEQ